MTNEKEKSHGIANIIYIVKLIWSADKGIVAYTLYKNISEFIFYVFFSVYTTKFTLMCIENHSSYGKLMALILLMAGIHIIVHFVSAGHAYYLKRRSPDVYRSVFSRVIDKSLEMDYKRFEQPDFYDKFTRALDEAVSRGIDVCLSLSFFFGNGIAAVMAAVIVVQTDPILLLFIIPSVIASFWLGGKSSRLAYRLDMESTRDKRIAAYTKRVFYEKKYAGEVRLYGIRNVLISLHIQAYEKLYAITAGFRKKIAACDALRWAVFCAMSLSLPMIYVAIKVKSNPDLPVAPYVAMVMALEFVSGNFSDCIDNAIDLRKHDMYIQNLRDFLDYTPPQENVPVHDVSGSLDDIEIKNVGFTYEGAEKPVIHDLNITIRKGERIALVGYNGAGKTTLVKLLMGLYKVTEGEIRINGENINSFEPHSYHSHFGTVFQDLQVFALPISQNVLMHEPQNEEERRLVIDSLEKAQFGDKLKTLPRGIDTVVSKEFDENGVALSGGETQKIAIARVFAKNPDIVILDEPSSALDPIAEYNMYKNMMELSSDKTVIFISHRLSSARVANRIYMLEDGTVAESGTHDELMAAGGKYAEMFALQAQNYQESLVPTSALKGGC